MKKILLFLASQFLGLSGCHAMTTDRHLYNPFVEQSSPSLFPTTEVYHGECSQPSAINIRKDAWQCQTAQRVFDPCFQHRFQDKHIVLCPSSPWEKPRVKILLATPPKSTPHQRLDMSKNPPWALEFVDGTRCIQVLQPNQDTQTHYICNQKKEFIGKLQRCKMIWQGYLHDSQDQRLLTDIARVWF